MEFTPQDLHDLMRARLLLENPSLAARIASKLGTPIEKGLDMLPRPWADAVGGAVHAALGAALDVAVATIDPKVRKRSADGLHRWAAAASGAVGGAFGLAALAVELPISTTIMLRSIADIARSEGEPLEQVESQLACLEVFALGGRTREDVASETGYFAVRTLLARTVSEAAQYIAERGVAEKGAPVLVRLIGTIASRFGATVTQKVAAQTVPILGAVGGAVVNSVFIDHFQDIARGHFTIRRLERKYGAEEVRHQYEILPMPPPAGQRALGSHDKRPEGGSQE